MKHCPVCKAKYNGKQVCRRCKTDLGTLIFIEEQAEIHFKNALSKFADKHFDCMFFHAKRSFSLSQTSQSVKLLVCAAILSNRFSFALSLWKQIRNSN